MASNIMGEGIMIIASVIVASIIAGVVMSQVGVFESTFTATSEGQKDIMLTKVKIVYATNTTDNHVNVWVKNIGVNPVSSLDQVDVYFGEINAANRYSYDQAVQNDNTWQYDTVPAPNWQVMETASLNITENSLQKGRTYLVTVSTPNGVTDEYIFSIPS